MAGKKISKDMDLAAGFFSQPATKEKAEVEAVEEKEATPKPSEKEKPPKEEKQEPTKNLGGRPGRPGKKGLKNEQFTLTMDPETYEKLKIVADEYTRGNFSGLIDEAIKVFCREKGINLAEIEVKKETIEFYKEKQKKKAEEKQKQKEKQKKK